MTENRPTFRTALAGALFVLLSPAVHAQADTPPLGNELEAQIDAVLLEPTEGPADRRDAIWRGATLRHGDTAPLFAELDRRLAAKPVRERELRLLRLRAHFQRRLGDLGQALRSLERIELAEETVADTLSKAEVLDALGRDKPAIETYDRLLKKDLAPALRNKILLRKALMAGTEAKSSASSGKARPIRAIPLVPIRPGATPVRRPRPAGTDPDPAGAADEANRSALARFAAQKGLDPKLKNQAAVILALTNEQKEAVEIFTPTGEGTARFRQEVRLAEWALEAGAHEAAQDHAWVATQNAKLKRDRRYALSLLVEGYRRTEKLDDLIERFAKTPDLDLESRATWIDLLRERGKVEEALRLFHRAGAADSDEAKFTADMRRELLEICRESNEDQVLEDAYRKLIADEPRFLEWREGLARFYLERGRRDDAIATWRPYLDVTDDPRYRMAAASSLMGLGLDDLSVEFARATMTTPQGSESALLFLFELHRDRGRHDQAAAALEELDQLAAAGSGIRKELADAYARLGDKKRSVAVLLALFRTLGDETTPDTRMKLALMLSETGDEAAALEHWQALWRQIDSVPRRRYVEERLMTVASRLGTLARIAIDLEKKLLAGTADDRDAGLLVRLYIKVNDPVSATEIIQEHMGKSGKKPVDVLTEKARVFQSCEDYYNYELVVEELIKVDPEGRADYLRQLAMSIMERGDRQRAREVLEQLKREESDSVSDEFEAGVLALAGMRPEALSAYRRGIARYPERIDTYLLLSNIQKQLGRHTRSAGMFQYLAATAEKDDLFTIAIDGILNMRDGRGNRGAPDRLVRWARRVVLERVARRPDKLYLLRLVADLSEELKDHATAVRALKTAVPVAGEQRTQLLRELMTMAKLLSLPANLRNLPANVRVIMQRGQPQANRPPHPELLMFGRRILGQGELVPPETYLELGSAFLMAGEVANATKTFNQASQLPEFAELRRQFAQAFEQAGYPKEALRIYEQILSVENGDAGLVTKVGELLEQTGRDEVALGLYRRGLELLLDRSIFVRTGVKEEQEPEVPASPFLYMPGNRNTDDWDRHHSWMIQGLLATLTEATAQEYLDAQREQIDREILRLETQRQAGRVAAGVHLTHLPRLDRRITLFRRVAAAFRSITPIDALDRKLLATFPEDDRLLESAVRFRLAWGYVRSARALIDASGRPEAERQPLQLLAGAPSRDGGAPGSVTPAEAGGLLLPLLVDGEDTLARTLLERLDLTTSDTSALELMPMLVGAATYLGDSDMTLSLCRSWINLAIKTNPGMMYTTVESVLKQGRIMLDESQIRSLTQHVLAQVIENPDRFSVFLRRLPELREQAGPDFLTREQVESLITSRLESSDRFVYGIENLFQLLPTDARSSVLRSVWNQLPKSQRAYFLLRLVSVLDNEFDPSFREFLTGGFRAGLDEADDLRILGYQVDSLAESGSVNLATRLQFVEALLAKDSGGSRIRASQAILLLKLDREDASIAILEKILDAHFPRAGGTPDQDARNSFYRLANFFRSRDPKPLLTALDQLEKARGPSIEMTRHRITLLRQLRRNEDIARVLEAAVKAYPEDPGFESGFRSALRTRGEAFAAARRDTADLKKSPENNGLRQRLVQIWRQLRNPVRALELREAGKPFEPKPAAETAAAPAQPTAPVAAAAKKERTPPATIPGVKTALDAGDESKALLVFRRVWRQFSPVVEDPYNRAIYMNQMRGGTRLIWPAEPAKKPVAKAPDLAAREAARRRNRGGVPEMFRRPLTEEEKKNARPRRPMVYYPGVGYTNQDNQGDAVPVQAVLSKTDAGRTEVRRQLRSSPPEQLGNARARDSYAALAAAAVAEHGRPKAIADLLDGEQKGECGKVDYGILAALLGDGADADPERLSRSLRGLTASLNPRDQGQVRRLARLQARAGKPDRAATLYRWCALLGNTGPRTPFPRGQSDLLDEVIRTLDGDARTRAVADILTFQDPGEFGREQYLTLALQTWDDLLDPAAALVQSRRALADATSLEMMPMRSACKLAARIHSRAGENEAAIRCLEIAACTLTPPANTRYPWYRQSFVQPGHLSNFDLGVLFPAGMPGFADPQGWLTLAVGKARAWQRAGRLQPSVALRLLSILAIRVHEHGRPDVALAALASLRKVASDSVHDQLWVADVARAVGDVAGANRIERKLFDLGRLQVERIPDVIQAIHTGEGAEAALAAAKTAASFTLHPGMLEAALTAAQETGDPAAIQHWEDLTAKATKARETLEAEDKKRAAEAKQAAEAQAKPAETKPRR